MSAPSSRVGATLEAERDRHLAELVELLRFPSVSAVSDRRDDVLGCAAWLREQLESIGLEHASLLETGGNPIVYGDWLHAGPDAPTALLYGHYDVQPPEPLELWQSPPFEPTFRDGRVYARGATDNKSQVFLNLKAIETLLRADGALPCNVKVIVEGEEELRADNLEGFVEENADLLQADVAVICDSNLYAAGVPGIVIGLRGMAALELTVRTAEVDAHSGVYGGAVPNALHALAVLLDSLHDPGDGRVLVEGFYEAVRPLTAEEREQWSRLPFDEARVRDALGLSRLFGEADYTPVERLTARPTLELNGAWGGYEGEGIKTVIPAEAHAKLSCRLVPDQEPEDVLLAIRRHLDRRTPPGAVVTIDFELAGARPMLTPPDHPAIRAAVVALAEAYGSEPVLFRSGWSVPVVEILDRKLGLDSVLLGFGLPDENAHAPNEHFHLDNFDRGLRTMTAFWHRLAAEGFD
ncbi:MAG TPA: dipeptidase [Gaiella sp.]